MPALLRSLLVLLLWLGSSALSSAHPPRREVEVMMFAVPETVWQARCEGLFKENKALWKRLDEEARAGRVQRPLELKCELVGDQPFDHRAGNEKEFVEGWTSHDTEKGVKPERNTRRFIGTVIRLQQQETIREDAALRVAIKLEHHIAPPVMQRINYANAATGAEREKLSVEYPLFEKIEWKGEISIWGEWRLVTHLLRPQRDDADAAPAMRYLLFIRRP